MKHLEKTFTHAHMHSPFWSVLAVVLQPPDEELFPLQFKAASGALALVKFILHESSAVGVHLPASLPHQVKVQQRQHGDTTCGVSSTPHCPQQSHMQSWCFSFIPLLEIFWYNTV